MTIYGNVPGHPGTSCLRRPAYPLRLGPFECIWQNKPRKDRSERAFFKAGIHRHLAGRFSKCASLHRRRSGSGSFCNSDLGLFPICSDWTGRGPNRRRPGPRWPMRGVATCLRKQGQARGAGRRKLPQIPGNLPKASSTRCVRRTAGSLPQQGSVGRTRRRELP